MMTPTAAANAYASMAQQVGTATQSASATQAIGAGNPTADGFADLVREAVETVSTQVQNADRVTADAVAGNADLVDVVTAISETELAMETIVGLRDRVIGAYESIMRMPI